MKIKTTIKSDCTLANAVDRATMGIIKRCYPDTPHMRALMVSAKLYDIVKQKATFRKGDTVLITFEPITDPLLGIIGMSDIVVQVLMPKAVLTDCGFTLKPDADLFVPKEGTST